MRNLFRLKKDKIKKKQPEKNIIKDAGNIFKLKRENKGIKDRNIRNLFNFKKKKSKIITNQ